MRFSCSTLFPPSARPGDAFSLLTGLIAAKARGLGTTHSIDYHQSLGMSDRHICHTHLWRVGNHSAHALQVSGIARILARGKLNTVSFQFRSSSTMSALYLHSIVICSSESTFALNVRKLFNIAVTVNFPVFFFSL